MWNSQQIVERAFHRRVTKQQHGPRVQIPASVCATLYLAYTHVHTFADAYTRATAMLAY